MSPQEEPRHGGKPNLVLGNNLAGTVIYRGEEKDRQKEHSVQLQGKALKKQEPELDDDNDDDYDGDNDGDDGEVLTLVMRKLNYSEVKGIGPVLYSRQEAEFKFESQNSGSKAFALNSKTMR